ncbi:MAG: FkbM family methyltransferase [Synergistaceae bacterium]|nr:FkbM family methyltransferase [Synergistaceae bacterium]
MLEKLLRPLLGRKSLCWFYWRLYKLALLGMNVGMGGDVKASGEDNVLLRVRDRASGTHPVTIFDVGANKGQYSANILRVLNGIETEIHCFEPGHETFRELSSSLGGREKVTLNNFGLSSKKSEGRLWYDKTGSGLASLYKRQLEQFGIDFEQSEAVKLDTLDSYIDGKNIAAIDLLKIDVEGSELDVLHGAGKALADGRIKAIQIEFGGCNIDSRTFIRDFWNLLHERFRMYRIMKDGLAEIRKYDERLEIFTCTNFYFELR